MGVDSKVPMEYGSYFVDGLEATSMFDSNDEWPLIDVTEKAVEETAPSLSMLYG